MSTRRPLIYRSLSGPHRLEASTRGAILSATSTKHRWAVELPALQAPAARVDRIGIVLGVTLLIRTKRVAAFGLDQQGPKRSAPKNRRPRVVERRYRGAEP